MFNWWTWKREIERNMYLCIPCRTSRGNSGEKKSNVWMVNITTRAQRKRQQLDEQQQQQQQQVEIDSCIRFGSENVLFQCDLMLFGDFLRLSFLSSTECMCVCVRLCDVKSHNILNKMSTRSLNIYWVGKTECFPCIYLGIHNFILCAIVISLLWPKFVCAVCASCCSSRFSRSLVRSIASSL